MGQVKAELRGGGGGGCTYIVVHKNLIFSPFFPATVMKG